MLAARNGVLPKRYAPCTAASRVDRFFDRWQRAVSASQVPGRDK
jgi:hypothetical protein